MLNLVYKIYSFFGGGRRIYGNKTLILHIFNNLAHYYHFHCKLPSWKMLMCSLFDEGGVGGGGSGKGYVLYTYLNVDIIRRLFRESQIVDWCDHTRWYPSHITQNRRSSVMQLRTQQLYSILMHKIKHFRFIFIPWFYNIVHF